MPRPSYSNEEILCNLRYDEEYFHRQCREYFFRNFPLTLNLTPSSLIRPNQLGQIQLEQIQDSCNKSTAIYFITPHFEPHTEGYGMDHAHRSSMIYSIYQQWFRGHDIDIDFGTFVAKLICLKVPSEEQKVTSEDIISIHKAWCDHVRIALPSCSGRKDLTGTETENPTHLLDRYGMLGMNQEQNMYYKLRPIFRALIIIIDDYQSEKVTETVVHLIRTNITSELSAPITFESISPKFSQAQFSAPESDNIVSTTLSAAIESVMALEARERTAFPERRRDPNVVDRRGCPTSYMEEAISRGYTGPEIQGPSTGFVKLAEGEDVLPPATTLVWIQRMQAGLPKPRLAKHRRRDTKAL